MWAEYIDSEKQAGDASRVIVTFNRAIEELGGLRPELWRDCADYIAAAAAAATAAIPHELEETDLETPSPIPATPTPATAGAAATAGETREEAADAVAAAQAAAAAAEAARRKSLSPSYLHHTLRQVLQRAIRHFPQDSQLWCRYIACLVRLLAAAAAAAAAGLLLQLALLLLLQLLLLSLPPQAYSGCLLLMLNICLWPVHLPHVSPAAAAAAAGEWWDFLGSNL